MISRRKILATGLGAGILPVTTQLASADQRFVLYEFPATSEPTPRTMPDRLAEIKNVKDFGAIGDGTHNDSPNIQAAIDWTTNANRGTIFFPPGTYRAESTITFNGANINDALSIRFLGVGQGSTIFGVGVTGFIFDRSSGSPNNTGGIRVFEGLTIQNPANTGGCIRIGSTNGAFIRDCTFSGAVCVTTEDSAGVSSQNIIFENCSFVAPSSSAVNPNGIIIGGSGAAFACDCRNTDVAWRIYGNGFHLSGCRVENTNTSFLLGLDSAGTNQGASGISIISTSCEGNGTAFHFAGTCTGCFIGSCGAQGHDKSNSGFPLGTNNSQYGLLIDADMAQACVFNTVIFSSLFDVAGTSIANATSRANNVFVSSSSTQSGSTGVGWIPPTNAMTAQFIACNIYPIWTFAQLPTGGNVLEGDEFDISDGTNGLTWGQTATNTGTHTTHYRVRYNGTNYTVMGV